MHKEHRIYKLMPDAEGFAIYKFDGTVLRFGISCPEGWVADVVEYDEVSESHRYGMTPHVPVSGPDNLLVRFRQIGDDSCTK